jgi:hypothetical protein
MDEGKRRSFQGIAFSYFHKVLPLPPATPAEITRLEERFGGPLPEDYKTFLGTVNGGTPGRSFLDYDAGCFDLEDLHGVGAAATAYDVEKASEWPSADIGHAVVAIGGDGSGDQLILLSPGDSSIYHWIHDQASAPVRVAASFTDLLSELVERVED